MTVWQCATLIAIAGAVGGLINTLMTQGKLRLPEYEAGVLCPGFVGNVLVGAFAALMSWALYGAGAGIEVARRTADAREVLSLTLGALAGAALVGVGGARWLNSEVDAKLLRAGINATAEKTLTAEQRGVIASAPAIEVLRTVRDLTSADPSSSLR
jgi:hypothetical protein